MTVLGQAIIIDRNSSPGCQLPSPPLTTLTFYYFYAHKWIDKYWKLFIKQGPAAAICLCNFEWSANMLMFQSLLQLLQFVTLVMFVCLHFLCSFNVRRVLIPTVNGRAVCEMFLSPICEVRICVLSLMAAGYDK